MTTLSFPTFSRAVPFVEYEFGMEPNAIGFPSPHSKQEQVLELPGSAWALSMRLAGLTPEETRMLQAWFAALRGRANLFTCHDLMNPLPAGTMRGTPVTVGTIAQGAVTCTINAGGGQASTTLLTGDKLSIAGELKVLTAPVTLNGSGQGTITFEPPTRAASISAGSSVVWNKPTAQFRLAENSWRSKYSWPRAGEFAIDAVESFS